MFGLQIPHVWNGVDLLAVMAADAQPTGFDDAFVVSSCCHYYYYFRGDERRREKKIIIIDNK